MLLRVVVEARTIPISIGGETTWRRANADAVAPAKWNRGHPALHESTLFGSVQMKISSRSADNTLPMPDSLFVPESVSARMHHALRAMFFELDRIGTAIAMGEAGDLDGAKALREKHANQRT